MSRPPLQKLIIVLSVVAFGAIHLPQAVAQNSGVVPTQPLLIRVTFSQTKVTEGDGGASANVELKLAFDQPSLADRYDATRQMTITYATVNGTATGGNCGTAGADFAPVSSVLTFTGQSSATINVQVCGDDLSEGNEQFAVRFNATEPNQATAVVIQPLVNSRDGIVTITDNEALPTVSITPAVQVNEPATGQASAVFTVSLTGPPTQRVATVDYSTAPGTAVAGNGCPANGRENIDYVTRSGTLTFSTPIGQIVNPRTPRTQQIQVPVCSDSRSEPNETFSVNLTHAVNAALPTTGGGRVTSPTAIPTIPVTRGTATIVD